MNRVNYLQLMTETYFNTFDVMFEDVQFLNFSFDYRKNQFVKQIERKQKSLDIPLKDFIEEFNFALVFLEDEILINIRKEIKQKSESELNEIRNNEATIYVPLQCVNTSLTDYLCIKDIDYIKKCFNSYVKFSQQPEAVKLGEVKKELHNHIFKGNSFEVWQSMFDEFGINESSRTDVKFMFEEMKKQGEGLIHNTVNQTTFLDWIRETYNGLIVEKTSNYSRTNTRLQAYLRAKELYNK